MYVSFHFILTYLSSFSVVVVVVIFLYNKDQVFFDFFCIATMHCLLNDKHLFLNVNDSFISFNGERSLMIMTMILNKTRIFHFLWFDSCFFLFGSIEEKINRFNIDFSFSLSIQISIFFKFKGVIHTFHSDLIHTHIPYLRKQIFWKIEMKKTFIARTLKNQTIAPYLNFADFNLDDIVVVVVYGQTYTTAIAQKLKLSSWTMPSVNGGFEKQNSNPTNQKKTTINIIINDDFCHLQCAMSLTKDWTLNLKKKNFSLFFSLLTE